MLLEWLSDYTIQNVVAGAALLGIISGILGSFAVLRKQSLLGDTLSHAALPGVCLGFILAGAREIGSILLGALITGALAALLMLASPQQADTAAPFSVMQLYRASRSRPRYSCSVLLVGRCAGN